MYECLSIHIIFLCWLSSRSPRDEDGNIIFQREGFGRQSMSEKRRAHLDPRVSEFYQKLKQSKEKGSDQYYSGLTFNLLPFDLINVRGIVTNVP